MSLKEYAAPVGSFPTGASPYGVMDMAGNVMEWCADWYNPRYYSQSPKQNPKGADTGIDCILRGGACLHLADFLRCASRTHDAPTNRYRYYGFRCVQDVTP